MLYLNVNICTPEHRKIVLFEIEKDESGYYTKTGRITSMCRVPVRIEGMKVSFKEKGKWSVWFDFKFF